ncbi:MAG TPA: penicillin-binding protein 2 [Xanthomonadales bacterium]|nr:penicillin-binding protein 2 [Xanthomonadales bacterium]
MVRVRRRLNVLRRGPRRVKEAGSQLALFRARAFTGFAIIFVCLAVLVGRFFVLQVVRHDEFHGRSEANRVKPRAVPPSRGLIYDRNGELLAENVPQYRLELVPEQVEDVADTIARLRQVIDIAPEDLERFDETRSLKRGFNSVPIKFQLSEEEVARFAVHRHEFPGVDVVPYLTRYYPQHELLTHVIGYVGRVDQSDQERKDFQAGWMTHIGKTGIERQYERELQGEAGYEQVEMNAQGRALRVLSRVPPKQGRNVYLTIDAQLQRETIAAFEGRAGSAIAIDPRNGDVLAMVSLPSYDANLFVNGISRKDYAALLAAPNRPLFNRALQGGYEPGSTMKPFIGLAGLELGVRTPATTVFSTGEFRLPGNSFAWHDWKKGGHGRIDLTEALAQSVNTYFYSLAVDIGIDRLGDYLKQFGFGAPTGIDLIGEGRGVLPSREWKRATQNKPWYPGETVIAGIGQGYWVVTPIQLATALATLAGGGVRVKPHLLLATQDGINTGRVPYAPDAAPVSFVHDPANLEAVRAGMIAVMHGPTGTARATGAGSPYHIAGKSGTAQRYRRKDNSEYDESRVSEHLRHQALFVAYAPAEAPTIAVAIVVEHGSSGSKAAAPVARRILDAWLARHPPDVAPTVANAEGAPR